MRIVLLPRYIHSSRPLNDSLVTSQTRTSALRLSPYSSFSAISRKISLLALNIPQWPDNCDWPSSKTNFISAILEHDKACWSSCMHFERGPSSSCFASSFTEGSFQRGPQPRSRPIMHSNMSKLKCMIRIAKRQSSTWRRRLGWRALGLAFDRCDWELAIESPFFARLPLLAALGGGSEAELHLMAKKMENTRKIRYLRGKGWHVLCWWSNNCWQRLLHTEYFE